MGLATPRRRRQDVHVATAAALVLSGTAIQLPFGSTPSGDRSEQNRVGARRQAHDDVAFPLVMSVAGCNCRIVHEDFDRCYRAVQSKDARFDGWFVTAVRTTGIYCRPSCPVRPPFAHNMRFYPTAAAAQRAGYRACKRCRPDASPGSPEWDIRDDLVAQGHEADR